MSERIVYSFIDTSIGQMLVAFSPKGMCRLDFRTGGLDWFYDWAHKWFDNPVIEKGYRHATKEIENQLTEYLEGKRKMFSVDLDLRGTCFQRRVWHTLMQITYGGTMSYKEVAACVDKPLAVRAVGQANNKNPVAIVVPCHRVVGSDGSVVGYGGGIEIKKKLLKLEGVSA